MTQKYVVQFPDECYWRDRNRHPRHFMHNATKFSLKKATEIAAQVGGVVKPAQTGLVPIGT